MICLFDRQFLFCKRAGSVGVNSIKQYLKRLWLVAIATILSKAFKIYFLFMSAIAHNWSFFTKFRQTFWSIHRVSFHLKTNIDITLEPNTQSAFAEDNLCKTSDYLLQKGKNSSDALVRAKI